ncbi:MAG: hypothetical protein KA251_01760 [Saprospiraceae bacterium]|nr:hypothetical protein [Saprospiraceae bacterium]
MILFTSQCKNELNEISDIKTPLTSRLSTSCWNSTQSNTAEAGSFQPGTYTIVNNCIRFTNHEEFYKTEIFLNNATAVEIESWYNSLPVLTSEKAYQDFMDQYNCMDNISISEINSLLSTSGNTIRYNWINEDELSISPKFMTYAGYRNMDGNFMIGDQIEAESDAVRITIFDGDWNKLTQIRTTPGYPSDTVSYEGDTTFILDKILESRIKCEYNCCSNNLSSTNYYGPDNRRRLKVELVWVLANSSRQTPWPKRFYATPKIDFRLIKLELDKKDDLSIWWCFKKHFTFKLQCDWLIQAKNVHKIEHDVTYSIVRDNARTCKVCGPLGTLISDEIGPYEINPEPFICPYRIIFTTNIFEELNQVPEASFKLECLKDNNPCICTICPPGYHFDGANCFSTVCSKSPFIWNNGFYYKSYPNGPNGGICPYGGNFDGANCHLGPVPYGYEGKAFVYNNCYYVAPKCP